MSNAVAKVAFLQGQAWAKAPDGTLRALTVGSTLNDDEILITAQGSKVELDSGNGELLAINGGLSVGVSRDLFASTATEPDEARLSDASVQEALTVLEQGGDLLDELEETAAGNSGGGSGSDGGSSFVRLSRLMESTDAQSFEYDRTSTTAREVGSSDGEFVNRAPVVTNQTLATNEDEPFSGRVIADDIEGDALTFTLSTAPINGVVILDPVTGQFTFTPNANYNGPESFVVTVTDSRGNATDTSITFNVVPVNDAPTTNDVALTTSEDVAVSGQVAAQDIEGDTLAYAVTGNPSNGTVTLNAATGAFVYTPNSNYNGSDSFIVTISDGNGGATTSTVSVGVTPVNDLPVAQNLSLTTDEEVAVNGQISASDIDGDTLGYSISNNPTNGTVVLNAATGAFVYTPNANYNGSDSFEVTISDGKGGTTTSTVTIGVNPLNDAPVASDLSLTTDEEVAVNGQISASDIDGDVLGYSISNNPTNGTVTLNAATGAFVYTPNSNYNGSDSFIVTISDGKGGTTTSTVTIGVNPLNDAPVASDLSLTTDEEVAVNGQISASDIDGDTLGYTVSNNPTNGTVTLNAATGAFVYTPNANYSGSDSFEVTISDGKGGTTISTVTIGVNPLNDAPVASDLSLTTDEDVAVNGQISASDIDGDTLGYTVSNNPTNGTVTLNAATGAFVYTPNANYNGSDSFEVTISDGKGGTTTSTVTIGVNPLNDAPVASDLNLTTDEEVAVNGQISASDIDGDTLGYSISNNPTNGTVTLNAATGAFVYTPNANYNGSDSFEVTISDGKGGTTISTVTIGVNPLNDAPVAVDDTATTDENSAVVIAVRANDTDIDGGLLSVTGVTQGANGSVVIDAVTNNPIYTPNSGFSGTDTFTYTVEDGEGGSATATVTVTVNPVNDAPVLTITQVNNFVEDAGAAVGDVVATFTTSDADNDTVTVTLSDTLNYALSGNTVTLTAAGLALVNSGADLPTFTLTPDDGTVNGAAVSANPSVTPANDAPVAHDDFFTINEGQSLSIPIPLNALSANDTDADGDSLIVYGVGGQVNGSISIVGNNLVFTPTANFSGTASFTYDVRDSSFATSTAKVYITVLPVDDPTIAVADTDTIAEGGVATGNVLANDTDPDSVLAVASFVVNSTTYSAGDTAIIAGVGSVTLTATGLYTFTPVDSDYNGTVPTITYTTNTGVSSTLDITVTPVNDAPQTNVVSVTGNEDALIVISLSGSDVDGFVADYVIKSLPANGELYTDLTMTTRIAAGDLVSGTVYFLPAANWNGNTSFSYAAQDDQGLEDATPATVSITVNPGADAAILSTGAGSVKEDTPAQSSASGTLTISDPDGASEERFIAQTNTAGTYGNFSINAAGDWVFNIDNTKLDVQKLKAGEEKTETFAVASADGTPTSVTITVIGTNDGPVAVNDNASVNQGAVLTLTPAQLLGNDTDLDGDTLSITSVQGASNGTVSLVGGNVVFTPNPSFHGSTSFTYTISDGHASSTATVNVNVVKTNNDPVANADSSASSNSGLFSEYFGYREGTDGLNLTNIAQINAFLSGRTADATFIAKTFDYGSANAFSNGLGSQGNLRTFLGSDAASMGATNPATTTDAIVRMRGFVALEAGTYNFKVTADDGYQIKVDGVVVAEVDKNQAIISTAHASFTLTSSGLHTVEVLYWDQANYARLKLELSSDGGTTYNSLGNFPVYQNASLVAMEDRALTIPVSSLLANDTDADGDTLSVTAVQGATNGTVSLAGGNVIFTPAANYSGPASFSYTISDGKGGSSTATVNLTIASVNDAPVAVNDSVIAKMNTAITVQAATLLANDSDIEGGALTLVSVQNAVNGTVALVNGNAVFTPATNFEGIGSFTYTIRDNFGATSTATTNVTVGVASAPSVVVEKALLAIARGDAGTSVKFPITTQLVDADGSESLSIRVIGVPTGLSFNAGTNLGGGVWAFVEADLPNLVLNIPGGYTTSTSGTALTVQVTSTEMYGGYTASVSSAVTLHAYKTTVDVTTTSSGNYTGNGTSELINGGTGDNIINGGAGNDVINGGTGNDTLSATAGSNIFDGGAGNDLITGGSGIDYISGGAGNDTMSGGAGNVIDVFVWSLGDQNAAGTPAVDTINNFATAAAGNNHTGGDVLDLRDLLQGEHVGANNAAGNLADYLHFEVAGGSTTIHISHTGGFGADSHTVGAAYTGSAETQKIVLNNVDLQSVYSGATTDQQIITQLLNNNKLITD